MVRMTLMFEVHIVMLRLAVRMLLVVVMVLLVLLSVILLMPVMLLCMYSQKKTKKVNEKLILSQNPPVTSSEIKDIRVDHNSDNTPKAENDISCNLWDKFNDKDKDSCKIITRTSLEKNKFIDTSRSESFKHFDEEEMGNLYRSSSHPMSGSSPLSGLPEFSHLGWGHWFTLRDLEVATNKFSKDNVIGEGGYGIVYHGHLANGSPVAIKKIFNNVGQAEKEFRVEVEAIGHVRHKNLVRLLGYCIEGTNRMLVYEYVNNGNLEQWLHGSMREHGYLTWEARMKVVLGTAKALAYLHEAIEPKVVHRDIKASNILIDGEFNAKLSDFGLAKLLGAGKSHITTRVMGTFGYVAPEYANTGLLNEKSDVYSFGVLLLEAITGRDPVDYSRPAEEVNLVDWLKTMVGNRRSEEVVDPDMETKPSRSALKRALLTALRCVDPHSKKRPAMGDVVRMLESDDYQLTREVKRRRNSNVTEPVHNDAEKSTK
ncbi:probable receptor-like protein kinase At5g18500 [Rutidosis leptorrhynchoides]|uniref:probable receptor-like protein kinase At5g18500 n=1 Tax=Rutidosis leptorrhynchoides TaxID=125765 RepID=UPI003A9A632C